MTEKLPTVTQFQGKNSGCSESLYLDGCLRDADPDKKKWECYFSSRWIGPDPWARLCYCQEMNLLEPDPQVVLGAPQSDKTIPTLPRSGQEHENALGTAKSNFDVSLSESTLGPESCSGRGSGTPGVPSRPGPPTTLFFYFLSMYVHSWKNSGVAKVSEAGLPRPPNSIDRVIYIYVYISLWTWTFWPMVSFVVWKYACGAIKSIKYS